MKPDSDEVRDLAIREAPAMRAAREIPTDIEPLTTAIAAREAMEDAPEGAINWNPLVNAMAHLQGVPVGSWEWLQAGPAPFSGSSGEHASYGWRHDYLLTADGIRAVLANYGHRRCYYTGAPFRQFGYEAAGRPHGWAPESPGDQADGSTVYWTSSGPVRVTGPDAEHMWLSPLWSLIDDQITVPIDTGVGIVPSDEVARFLATLLVSSAVGMVRDKDGDGTMPYPWTYGDRATGRLLHTMTEGFRRGCMLAEDVRTAAVFIRDVVLAFYERGPGIHSFGSPRDGRFPIGLFNGLFWLIPVCHDAAVVLRLHGVTPWAARFEALVRRWSRWLADLHATVPDDCFRADTVFADPSLFDAEHPPGTLAGLVRPEDFRYSWDYRPWAYRAVAIAASTPEGQNLADARDRILEEFRDDVSKMKWLVGPDGEYVV